MSFWSTTNRERPTKTEGRGNIFSGDNQEGSSDATTASLAPIKPPGLDTDHLSRSITTTRKGVLSSPPGEFRIRRGGLQAGLILARLVDFLWIGFHDE